METDIILQNQYDKEFLDLDIANVFCPKVIAYRECDSTNDRLKILADEGAKEGTTMVSYYQSNGHGRSGRSFFSPKGGNLYMSILLRPESMDYFELITPAAAVAVARAVRKVSSKEVQIKWVNDIFLDNKKICGILASAYGFENGHPYVVLGIGINVSVDPKLVPEDIRDIYGTIYKNDEIHDDIENIIPKIAKNVYGEYMNIYNDILSRSFIDEYRNRSMLIGKKATYLSGEETIEVEVLDIDNDGRIVVKEPNGNINTYRDGEIRIKLA